MHTLAIWGEGLQVLPTGLDNSASATPRAGAACSQLAQHENQVNCWTTGSGNSGLLASWCWVVQSNAL